MSLYSVPGKTQNGMAQRTCGEVLAFLMAIKTTVLMSLVAL